MWQAQARAHFPLKIHRIRIEKFRKIQEPLEFDLTTPRGEAVGLAALAGPNGCGKTTILEAILFGLGREKLLPTYLPAGDWAQAELKQARIELDVTLSSFKLSTWIRTAESHEHNVPDSNFELLEVGYFSSARTPTLVGAVKPLTGAGRSPGDTERNRIWRLKQRINDERARAGYGKAPGRDEHWLERLNVAWRTFHSDDGTSLDAQIVDENATDLLTDLFVLDRDNNRICSIDQASSGELELLAFAGSMIIDHTEDGIILIDEPELHLHPEWQVAILPALQELAPKAQFIVASHADAVWEQTAAYSRFLLVGEGDSRSDTWRQRVA